MKKIKDTLQTTEVLQTKLHSIVESGFADFVKTTNARRIAVRGSIRFVVVAALFIVAIAVFLFLAEVDLNTLQGKIIAMTALLWVSVLLISGRDWFIGSTLLAREVNMALVPILANTFNRTLLYTYNDNVNDTVAQMLDESGLLLGSFSNLNVKNVYTVFSDTDMRVHEVAFDQKEFKPKTKTVRYYATFIDVNLQEQYEGETLFSTPAYRYGFSHEQFVHAASEEEKFTEVETSLDASKSLSIFSTQASGSQEYGSAELKQSLIDWSEEAKVNIRGMRKGTKLYILVPASRESTSYTSTSTRLESIERYARRIAQPIWRALMLAESVK
jgi:hypothetical protein